LQNAGKSSASSKGCSCFLCGDRKPYFYRFFDGAKSIFRFGDLTQSKDRKLTEYVLIGTLISFGTAIGTGFLVQYALTLLS
jgi:hypothetical protein